MAEIKIIQSQEAKAAHEAAMARFLHTFAPSKEQMAAVQPAETRHIAMVIYPGMFPLDMVGPLSILGGLQNTQIHLLWKNSEPVTGGHLTITPTGTFEECPPELELLLVPGGSTGTLAAMQDRDVVAFVKKASSRAKYTTSVCTGSLILGAAGLLNGRRATTHWATLDVLRHFGAEPVQERFVEDGHILTAAGVSAGIDFALHLAAKIAGEGIAKALQLNIEYDPAPPFDAGTPAGAGPIIHEAMATMYTPLTEAMKQVG